MRIYSQSNGDSSFQMPPKTNMRAWYSMILLIYLEKKLESNMIVYQHLKDRMVIRITLRYHLQYGIQLTSLLQVKMKIQKLQFAGWTISTVKKALNCTIWVYKVKPMKKKTEKFNIWTILRIQMMT